jgi:two-component system chemotaxis response regulator CheB
VITLDIALPKMSGLEAAEQIMAFCPTPILVVSSATRRDELISTYDVLAAGAVEALDKPSEQGDRAGVWESQLLQTLKLIARVRVISHPRARLGRRATAAEWSPPVPRRAEHQLLALGASTGGPGAILKILQGIAAPCPVPILLVLHIGEAFTAAFTEWLGGLSGHRVVLATEGLTLASLRGTVAVAPPSHHLAVTREGLRLSSEPRRHGFRPSIDVLFQSIAESQGARAAAGLLTGMGKDGAEGLLAIKEAGGFTVVQDEASSVVYGMPREAVGLGAACQICPLDEIGSLFNGLLGAAAPSRTAPS